MNRSRPWIGLFFALVVFAGLAAPTRAIRAQGEQESRAGGPLVGLKKCLRGFQGLKAQFVHEIIHPLKARGTPREGHIYLKPRRFRLEYDDTPGAAVVFDGRTIRSWNPTTGMLVITSPQKTLVSALLALFSQKGSAEDFRVKEMGSESSEHLVVELVPRRFDPFMAKLVVVVGQKCPSLERLLVVDHGGIVNRYTFENLKTDVKLDNRLFELDSHPDARVVRP